LAIPRNSRGRRNRCGAVPIALALVVIMAACGSSDVGAPATRTTSVTLTVVDGGGGPVEGLEIGLANRPSADLQLQPARAAAQSRAAVVIPINVPVRARVWLTVHDVEGTEVRRLVADSTYSAGRYEFVWDGRAEGEASGARLPAGDYSAHLVCRSMDDSQLLFEAQERMAMVDFDPGRYSVGTTDGAGRVKVAGNRFFPCFYELPNQMQRDEAGEDMGEFGWLEEILVLLRDPESGAEKLYARPIKRGANAITLVWDPPARIPAGDSGDEPRDLPGARDPDRPPPPLEFLLYGPRPNPFN
jgi:hypothetical protein